jgi:Leucine Rich repeat
MRGPIALVLVALCAPPASLAQPNFGGPDRELLVELMNCGIGLTAHRRGESPPNFLDGQDNRPPRTISIDGGMDEFMGQPNKEQPIAQKREQLLKRLLTTKALKANECKEIRVHAAHLSAAAWKTLHGLEDIDTVVLTHRYSASPRVGDSLKHLVGFGKLRAVYLQAEIAGDDLAPLADIKGLQTLSVAKSRLTDSGLGVLRTLRGVRELDLSLTQVTGSELKHLPEPAALRTLNLSDTRLTAEGVEAVGKLTRLETLQIDAFDGPDSALAKLTGLNKLRTFCIRYGAFTDAAAGHLAERKSLEVLDLTGTSLTDAGLEKLAGLAALRVLNLSSTDITDKGLKHLAASKGLEVLSLWNTAITDDGLAILAKVGFKSLRSLHLSGTRITDAGLKHLAALKTLEELTLTQAFLEQGGCSAAAIAELHKALPKWKEPRDPWSELPGAIPGRQGSPIPPKE